jgi:hydrogenase maturation protein HypF
VRRIALVVVGTVQGVGFRPFVQREALARGLAGFVRNSPRGVQIEAQGEPAALDAFARAVIAGPGAGATVERAAELPPRAARGFAIAPSEAGGAAAGPRASLPPDLAPCAACRAEVAGAGRRRRYPFTSCTRCGPRGSIALRAPWDRAATTMAAFAPCAACAAEYGDLTDHRCHAQTIACPRCGPRLWLEAAGARVAEGEAALAAAAEALRGGRIVALKGVGGWQLVADATAAAAIAELRRRKHREARPFAVLFADLDAVARACDVTAAERAALADPAAPIVLVRTRAGAPLAAEVAPGGRLTGAMLPASPLHALLAEDAGRPLVCTSGNLAGEPLCTGDDDARRRLAPLADLLLGHDRPIARPLDDSVVRVTARGRVLVRRARGYAPRPLPRREPGPVVLALGAHLKATVALALADEIWLSAHVGDLEAPEAIDRHERTARELLAAAGVRPDVIACDLHPALASTALAERLARETGAALARIPHHAAHVAAVAAEHAVGHAIGHAAHHAAEHEAGHAVGRSLLGLAWDGMGLGEDGALWGGEAILLDGPRATRVAHLRPFALPGGEAAIREPRRAALGLLAAAGLPRDAAAAWFAPAELAVVEAALARGVNAPLTTSAGRLFDAIAALAGLRGRSRFEAEAAIALEAAALDEPLDAEPYPMPLVDAAAPPRVVDWAPAAAAILADVAAGVPAARIAARFHAALAEAAVAIARAAGAAEVALAGGCFQNARLAAAVTDRLAAAGVTAWMPRELPPGDGGLAVGQALLAARRWPDVPRSSG